MCAYMRRPELNAAELCNGRAKDYMVKERGSESFVQEVYNGYGKIDWTMMRNFYRHVIESPHRQPKS